MTFLMASIKNGLVLLVLWIAVHGGNFIILHLEYTSLETSFPFSLQTTCKKKRFIIIFFKINSIIILYNVKYVYYIRYNVQILLHQ